MNEAIYLWSYLPLLHFCKMRKKIFLFLVFLPFVVNVNLRKGLGISDNTQFLFIYLFCFYCLPWIIFFSFVFSLTWQYLHETKLIITREGLSLFKNNTSRKWKEINNLTLPYIYRSLPAQTYLFLPQPPQFLLILKICWKL